LGRIPEGSKDSCTFRGELLGVLAIHLVLLVVNELNKELAGTVRIASDCLGALGRVEGQVTKRREAFRHPLNSDTALSVLHL
jgi:hypothetical protein